VSKIQADLTAISGRYMPHVKNLMKIYCKENGTQIIDQVDSAFMIRNITYEGT